jgi:hypothetical protein
MKGGYMTFYEKIQINKCARALAQMNGWDAPEGHDFENSKNLREVSFWNMAATAYDLYKVLLR